MRINVNSVLNKIEVVLVWHGILCIVRLKMMSLMLDMIDNVILILLI